MDDKDDNNNASRGVWTGQQQEDYSDDYGVAVNGGKSVKDKTDDDDGVPVTLCYVCHFERRQQDFQGTQDCDDPFHRSGIPQVACQGACGVSCDCLPWSNYLEISKVTCLGK